MKLPLRSNYFLQIASAALFFLSYSCSSVYKTVDQEKSKVYWSGSHILDIDPHTGYVKVTSGTVSVKNGKISKAAFSIDMSGIIDEDISDKQKRNGLEEHLKSPDFFNVDNFPYSSFKLTKIEKGRGDYNSNVSGMLTLLDSTQLIYFPANITVTDKEVYIKSAEFGIDRTRWGINFNSEGMVGIAKDRILSNTIKLTIEATVEK